jgi:hypothetical protein
VGVILVPVESVEEFKVSISNQTSDFNNSSGMLVQLVTKRASNEYHGYLYIFYFDTVLGAANSWSNNHTPVATVYTHHFQPPRSFWRSLWRTGLVQGIPGREMVFLFQLRGPAVSQRRAVHRKKRAIGCDARRRDSGSQCSPDQLTLRRAGKLTLHVATAEGSELRPLGESIDVGGAADWSRDGQWIVTGATDANSAGIFKIPVSGCIPVRLATGQASNPVWSPAGNLIAYARENVGFYPPLLAVRADGTPVKLPSIEVLREGVRVRFLPDGSGLIYMQGPASAQNLWLLDLATMKSGN